MIYPSSIKPDVELASFLKNKITVGLPGGGTQKVKVYSDWERPTNELPDDFIVAYINGGIEGAGPRVDYASGVILVNLYCKMNDDGSVKKNRIEKILAKFEKLVNGLNTEKYCFEYSNPNFVTPTTPNQSTGYSVTSLNLTWHTTNNFNNQ